MQSPPTYATATTRAGKNRQVYESRALRTCPGGLVKADLKVSASTGKIVSRRASSAAKRNFVKNGLAAYKIPKRRSSKSGKRVRFSK